MPPKKSKQKKKKKKNTRNADSAANVVVSKSETETVHAGPTTSAELRNNSTALHIPEDDEKKGEDGTGQSGADTAGACSSLGIAYECEEKEANRNVKNEEVPPDDGNHKKGEDRTGQSGADTAGSCSLLGIAYECKEKEANRSVKNEEVPDDEKKGEDGTGQSGADTAGACSSLGIAYECEEKEANRNVKNEEVPPDDGNHKKGEDRTGQSGADTAGSCSSLGIAYECKEKEANRSVKNEEVPEGTGQSGADTSGACSSLGIAYECEEKEANRSVKNEEVPPDDGNHKKGEDRTGQSGADTAGSCSLLGIAYECKEKEANRSVKNEEVPEHENPGIILNSSVVSYEEESLNEEDKNNHDSEDVNTKMEIIKTSSVDIAMDAYLDDIYQSNAKEEPLSVTEEKNFVNVLRLLQIVGVNVLRQYFCGIHPTWSNKPSDALNLDRGKLILEKHQEQVFNSGNTEEWDVSLLIRVLRFSKRCSLEVNKHHDINKAIMDILDVRNQIVSHASSARLCVPVFNQVWNLLKASVMTLGAKEEDVDSTLQDYSSLMHEQYKSRFLEQIHCGLFLEQEIRTVNLQKNDETKENVALPELTNSACWNNWPTFIEHVNNFNSSQNHFILVVDVMPEQDLENFKVLSVVPWKMVLDFNPSSEDDGFHKSYVLQSTLQLLVSPWTPGQIKDSTSVQLPKQIDKQRTQWLFVNGREQDRESCQPKDFPGWEHSSKKQISRYFACCSDDDKFDHQKSITCILLPISESSVPYVDITLRRLEENFEEFSFNFFCFDKTSYKALAWIQEKLVEFALTSLQVKQGIESAFHLSTEAANYRMPTSQAGVSVSLTPRTYAYLSEHFQLLYEGCENEFINLECDEEERDKIEEEHRRSFLSGNLISPASLYFNHDAKRTIEDDIQVHIQRMLCQPLKHSVIVEIMHSPGTGGSTIARRVLWNLHKSFPCVVVKLPVKSDFDELDQTTFIRSLCERISSLEDECGIPVLVLVDDLHHWRLLGVSNRIVRTLNVGGKRSIVLVCLHNIGTGGQTQTVHKLFSVSPRLETNPADLKEFRSKYHEYMGSERGARRVFHFPLLSMIHAFRPRLRSIVFSTLNELNDLEKDIAAFVAFLQIYAGQPTPAVLLYEAFKFHFELTSVESVTYDSIKERFTDNLLNLMVRENPRSRVNSPSECLERYTLQHVEVAKLVLDKHLDRMKQTLFMYVDEFLDHKVLRLDKFLSLYCDLLLYHKGGDRELRFSLLFNTLNNYTDERKAAQLFCKAAEKVADPRIYGNAARFFAKMGKPNFVKAKELVNEGLILSKTKGRTQSIQDTKGVILCIELKNQVNRNKVRTIEQLEQLAEMAISAFKAARDFPPTFHSPLIGEVEVWLSCIDWIVKNCCDSDEEKAVKFLTTNAPPFFRTCVGDCYTLLDRVDLIIRSSTTLPDPEKAQEHSNRVRFSLIKTIRPKGNKLQSSRAVIEDICKTLLSVKTLPSISEKQIKRYKVWTLLSLVRDQQTDKQEDIRYLVKLLEEMVLIEKDASFARHFLRMCPQISGPRSYDLEKAMKVSNFWLAAEDYDPLPYFYCMVISFMQIINGHGPAGYYGIYQEMLRKLREKSRNHCKRTEPIHFLGTSTDGMSQLVSRAALFTGRDYRNNDSEAVTSFWTVESRQKLKECVGRVRVKFEGKSEVTTVELLQGGVELHVKKNSSIGKPGKDFDKDTKVYFVVSFNLGGPVANGITFKPFQEKTE